MYLYMFLNFRLFATDPTVIIMLSYYMLFYEVYFLSLTLLIYGTRAFLKKHTIRVQTYYAVIAVQGTKNDKYLFNYKK